MACHTAFIASTSGLRTCLPNRASGPSVRCLQPPRRSRQCGVIVQASAGPSLLQKLGRVLKEKAAGDFDRVFKKGTEKTRERLGFLEEVLTYWNLDDYEETLEELEDALIAADFGVKTSSKVVEQILEDVKLGKLKTGEDIRVALKANIIRLLTARVKSSDLNLRGKPAVILVIGVNGAGKTTTIGKMAYKFAQEDLKVYLAPGDTFRAAAAQQLEEWARRANATMGEFKEGASSNDVIGKSCRAAKQSGEVDVLIADTAGRLHTAYGLMEELAKVKKEIGQFLPGQPDEVLLVLDGTTGLNMLNQAREFHETVGLTGLILTKLDGSARGGAVVSVVDELAIPIKFIGVGESAADLQPFDAESFVEALFPKVPEGSS